MPAGRLVEPLDSATAKRLIRQILDNGKTIWETHVTGRMAQRKLTTVDCVNVLRGGQVGQAELERGSWRYPVRTARICVVVTFRSKTELAVVTAWRIRT